MPTVMTVALDLRLLTVAALLAMVAASPARGAPADYSAVLSGANEAAPNPSPGVGLAHITVDSVAHTMRVQCSFSGLLSNDTAAHIHAATTTPGSGTAGVATTTPSFAGFPLGVTAGTFDATLNMSLASSYNPSFVTAHGGLAGAEAFLYQSIRDGRAYFNIHSTLYPGGEIRGFLVPGAVGVAPAFASTRPALRIAGANPFGSELRLGYTLLQASPVELAILDLAGRRVRTLISGDGAAGEHEVRWSGDTDTGSRSKPGLYFARLRADRVTITMRVIRIE